MRATLQQGSSRIKTNVLPCSQFVTDNYQDCGLQIQATYNAVGTGCHLRSGALRYCVPPHQGVLVGLQRSARLGHGRRQMYFFIQFPWSFPLDLRDGIMTAMGFFGTTSWP